METPEVDTTLGGTPHHLETLKDQTEGHDSGGLNQEINTSETGQEMHQQKVSEALQDNGQVPEMELMIRIDTRISHQNPVTLGTLKKPWWNLKGYKRLKKL